MSKNKRINDSDQLVWISADLAELLSASDSDSARKAIIEQEIARRKFNVQMEIEGLDNDLLTIEGYQQRMVDRLDEIVATREQQYNDLFEKMDSLYDKLWNHNKEFNKKLEESGKAIDQLDSKIRSINVYIPEHLVRLVESIEYMKSSSLELLKKLFDISTEPTQ